LHAQEVLKILESKVWESKVNFSIWINFHFVFGNSHLTSIEVELGAVYTNEFLGKSITCMGSLGCQRQFFLKGFLLMHKRCLWGQFPI
jgi:hypothetical protein